MKSSPREVTQLLRAWRNGDRSALDKLWLTLVLGHFNNDPTVCLNAFELCMSRKGLSTAVQAAIGRGCNFPYREKVRLKFLFPNQRACVPPTVSASIRRVG